MGFSYDGSYKGFLSALGECFRQRLFKNSQFVEITARDSEEGCSLFEEQKYIQVNDQMAGEAKTRLVELLDERGYCLIIDIFRSGITDKEGLILSYIRCVVKKGSAEANNPANPVVLKAIRTAQSVRLEVHRFYGILRFEKQPDGILYSIIEPDHNILDLLVPHFSARFPRDKWIIHDKKRGLAVFWDTKEAVIAKKDLIEPGYGEHQDVYKGLWKQYFKTAAIEDRKNVKLQNHMLPKRYRKNMTEF